VKEDEMLRYVARREEKRNSYKFYVRKCEVNRPLRKCEGNRPLGKPRGRLEDNVIMGLKEI
jgi:hypothetical protein